MTIQKFGRSIERVRIVDDDPKNREALELPIEDLKLIPVPVAGPLLDINDFVAETQRDSDAAICDYRLKIHTYSTFNGAESVALLYQQQFPAILCTIWQQADIDEMRRFRRFIPVLLTPDELDLDSIVHGFEQCLEEFNDHFKSNRKAWRTLIRIEDIDDDKGCIYIVIPGWDSKQGIRLLIKDIPDGVRAKWTKQSRFFAKANVGAEKNNELYFTEWEF